MRPIVATKGAAGPTAWIPVDRLQKSFGIGLAVVLSSGANLTYKLQHTFDDPQARVPCQISRTTTTATLTLANHGLSVGDSIVVSGANDTNLDGTYAVASVVDANNITYTVANSGATSAAAFVATLRVFDHPILTGLTARQDGNYAFPVAAVRLNITAYTSGFAQLLLLQPLGV